MIYKIEVSSIIALVLKNNYSVKISELVKLKNLIEEDNRVYVDVSKKSILRMVESYPSVLTFSDNIVSRNMDTCKYFTDPLINFFLSGIDTDIKNNIVSIIEREKPSITIVKEFNFIENFNNKLDCNLFSTIRLHDDSRKIGDKYVILLNRVVKGLAILNNIKTLTLKELDDFTCLIDTGSDKDETIKLIQSIYSERDINWDTQLLDVCLLRYE